MFSNRINLAYDAYHFFRKKFQRYRTVNLPTWYWLVKVDVLLPTEQNMRDLAPLPTRNLKLG